MMESLRALANRLNRREEPPREDSAFDKLSARLAVCEDGEERAQVMREIRGLLPDMLFLASMCYEGDDPAAPVHDKELHATVGSKKLYAANVKALNRGNPGYRLSGKQQDKRRMCLRTLVNRRTSEEWVPLFTDFEKLLAVFGRGTRVTLISFEEARQLARPYHGLMINPGPACVMLEQQALRGGQ